MATKITHYDQGDVWQPQATFTVSGTPTDPTTITVKVKNPAGTITTMGPVAGGTGGSGITRVSTGVFKIAQALDAQGYWFARFEGTGAAAATEDHEAIVDPSEFFTPLDARALVGLAETKDWLNQNNVDTSNDLELVRVIGDISGRFHEEAGREIKPVGTNPQVRLFDVDELAWRYNVVTVGDMASVPTLVRLIGTDWQSVIATVASTDIICEPVNRQASDSIRQLVFRPPARRLFPGMRVEVTGTFGFPSVPGNIRQAVLDAVMAVYDRDVEHYRQDLSPSSDQSGGLVVAQVPAPLFISLPPSALAVARLYRDPLIG